MARRWKSLRQLWREAERHGQTHLSRAIYNELYQYAIDKQFYPVENALYRYMTEPQLNEATHCEEPARYPYLGHGSFHYWFMRLCDEKYIAIDLSTSRAVRCESLEIVERENTDPFE